MRYEVDLSEASKFARTPAYGIPVIRAAAACGPDGGTLGATNRFLTRDGSPWIPIAGEMHYSRIAAERWDTELAKMAAAGIDVVSTYVFWNHHEEREGEWDFSGNRNVRRFVELCARHGLHVIVRLGPFCHGEVRNGGLPDWLYGKSYEVRSLDAGFLDAVRGLYAHIAQQLRGLYFKDGGPIIAAQVDNEYMASSAPWEMTTGISREWVPSGHDGAGYLERLRDIAIEEGIDPPMFTCTGWQSPVPDDMLPLWGGYAYRPWLFYDGVGAEGMTEHPATDEYRYRRLHGSSTSDGFDPRTIRTAARTPAARWAAGCSIRTITVSCCRSAPSTRWPTSSSARGAISSATTCSMAEPTRRARPDSSMRGRPRNAPMISKRPLANSDR